MEVVIVKGEWKCAFCCESFDDNLNLILHMKVSCYCKDLDWQRCAFYGFGNTYVVLGILKYIKRNY